MVITCAEPVDMTLMMVFFRKVFDRPRTCLFRFFVLVSSVPISGHINFFFFFFAIKNHIYVLRENLLCISYIIYLYPEENLFLKIFKFFDKILKLILIRPSVTNQNLINIISISTVTSILHVASAVQPLILFFKKIYAIRKFF